MPPAGYVAGTTHIGNGKPYLNAGGGGLIYGVWTNTNPWGIFGAPANGGKLLYNDILYWFHPSKYDLNLDCVVDVQDLKVLVPYYGLTLTYGDLYVGSGAPGLVDINDFVAIAKHFGPVDP